jgi:hypothetical protein
VGVDASLDTGMNFQIAAVLRHLDGTRFRAGTVIVDFLHEPTLSATVSLDPRPGHFGTAVGLFSLTALNLHFQRHGHDLVELALGQMGVGLDGRGNPVFGAARRQRSTRTIHISPYSSTAVAPSQRTPMDARSGRGRRSALACCSTS